MKQPKWDPSVDYTYSRNGDFKQAQGALLDMIFFTGFFSSEVISKLRDAEALVIEAQKMHNRERVAFKREESK
jgi:hypothetical protein